MFQSYIILAEQKEHGLGIGGKFSMLVSFKFLHPVQYLGFPGDSIFFIMHLSLQP